MNTSWTLRRAIQGVAAITVSEASLEHRGCATNQVCVDDAGGGQGGVGQVAADQVACAHSHTGVNYNVTQRDSDEASAVKKANGIGVGQSL